MPRPTTLKIDLGDRHDEAERFKAANPDIPLREFVRTYPEARFLPGEFSKHQDRRLADLIFDPREIAAQAASRPAAQPDLRRRLEELREQEAQRESALNPHDEDTETYPEKIKDKEAVLIAYHHELEALARFLRNNISVLVSCDKILTEFIYEHVCAEAGKEVVLDSAEPEGGRARSKASSLDQALQGGPAATAQSNLRAVINNLKDNQVLVLRSLEMLDTNEAIDIVYHGTGQDEKPLLLGFLDPSLEVKKVLTNRFSVHLSLTGLPRYVCLDSRTNQYTVTQLLTRQERACFQSYDPEGLYKNVSGLNAIQFRNAMRYVAAEKVARTPAVDIYRAIRQFKTSTSDEIEIPDTDFDSIGGYDHIKLQLRRIITLVAGPIAGIDERQRAELIPRGFVFHGPPGTGKTLFAKAIANELNATIQMISGPEIMDKYVGQSEDNLRRIFATARRNAPAVVFFDEFDSIAAQRSNYSDGGTRANNAVVAQLLTELDGFRRDQTVLVIGTTNRIDIIDEALLRPSRLRPIEIGNPDYAARRSVAHIHAHNFGIDRQLMELYSLVAEDMAHRTEPRKNVTPEVLEKLFKTHEPFRKRWEIDAQRDTFVRELNAFFEFARGLEQAEPSDSPESESLRQLTDRVAELGQKYGIDLRRERGNGQADNGAGLIPTMRDDLNDLYAALEAEQGRVQSSASEAIYNTVLDLIAEYTENFNNDEIRAVFQEASLEYHLEGQIITPRYLGQKIGLIRKRRDERESVHLSSQRGARR
jgi:transitional endoplasmic reticulum ATPase